MDKVEKAALSFIKSLTIQHITVGRSCAEGGISTILGDNVYPFQLDVVAVRRVCSTTGLSCEAQSCGAEAVNERYIVLTKLYLSTVFGRKLDAESRRSTGHHVQ